MTYTAIKDYLTNCLKYELVINNLNNMKELCKENPYSNLLELINTLIIKYNNLYEDNTILLRDAIKEQDLVKIEDGVIKNK